ncbi:hypothetical protein BpHYR1_006652 [Brachionus plicatilis]|uniref:Uncharacterized protein n=1 Tax=Brachionus plicatilis TaxID=10195 RepID=A0A3M7R1Q8_BRAPC|nr:hypothetical protein BpHYR1_006652 [Brachionus plicatilis]
MSINQSTEQIKTNLYAFCSAQKLKNAKVDDNSLEDAGPLPSTTKNRKRKDVSPNPSPKISSPNLSFDNSCTNSSHKSSYDNFVGSF